MGIWVLRYGHRRTRDARASTHIALAARALGAQGVIFEGERDEDLMERLRKVSVEWGGKFEIRYVEEWQNEVGAFKKRGGCFVHLTMYGLPVQEAVQEARKKAKDCLVLVGSQKVPTEAYELADFNISVTNQPHSEIAALAIFLDRYFEGRELDVKFGGGRRKITPRSFGKNVVLCEK